MKRGVDVSKWQGEMDWQVTASRGIEVAYIRGAYGVEKDPYYAQNWVNIQGTGIQRGVYLYPLYKLSFDAQLDYWLKLPNVEQGDLPPAIDIEFNTGEKKPDVLYQMALLKLLARVEKEFGKRPVVYTSPSIIRTYLRLPEFSQYPLWIANYRENAPDVPLPWQPMTWYGWQHCSTGNGKYYGASSRSIDMDVFRNETVVTTVVQQSSGISLRVKMKERKPASFIRDVNAAGKPMFSLYPKDTAPVAERIFLEGEVSVFPYPLTGDGGARAYPVYKQAAVQLYVMVDDIGGA